MCADVYGSRFTPDLLESGVRFTNTMYGARGIPASKIVFPNGAIDPWHALGVVRQDQVAADSLVLFIKDTAHCADLYPDAETDPPQLRAARARISSFLRDVVADKASPPAPEASLLYRLLDVVSLH